MNEFIRVPVNMSSFFNSDVAPEYLRETLNLTLYQVFTREHKIREVKILQQVTILREREKYEETLRDIEESLGIIPGFMKALPEDVLVSEWPLFKKYMLGESKIPPKYRELIGLAIAANIKCPYCQLFHTGAAKLRGATEEELAEVAFLASFSSRWSAMIHAQHYDYDTFEKEVHQIGAHLKKTLR